MFNFSIFHSIIRCQRIKFLVFVDLFKKTDDSNILDILIRICYTDIKQISGV